MDNTGGPTIIGRYELRRALASGGMATVHLGRMRSETGLGRTVALKRMHPHFATDPPFVAMFFDEARLAMRLHHPNIVQTFDIVSTDEELLLVMEYIHGESLSGLLRACSAAKERMPPAVASAILGGVLAGLHAAHEARTEDGAPLEIVHRDVSPQNVLVGTDGVARLLDFGIAKAAGRVHSTEQGTVKGKFAYMAPEQLTSEDVDRRADIWAASVVLWETLTGERLFRAETPGALVNAVLTSRMSPPSKIVPELPRAVDELLMCGLARQKRVRFATAREMAVALEAALPPATPRAVGEWVDARATAALRKRAALVKEVEATGGGAAGSADVLVPTLVQTGQDEMASASIPGDDVSIAGVGAATAPKKAGRVRAWMVAVVVTAALAVPLSVIAVRANGRAKAGVSEASPRNSATDAVVASSPATPSVETSTANPVSPPIASASSSAPPIAGTPATPSRPRVRPHPTTTKPDCSNPFVVDSRGIRVPRPECF